MIIVNEKQERTYAADVPVSVTCDHCGAETLLGTASRGGGRVEADGFWYGSKRDGFRGRWDICDACVPALEAFFSAASNTERRPE